MTTSGPTSNKEQVQDVSRLPAYFKSKNAQIRNTVNVYAE